MVVWKGSIEKARGYERKAFRCFGLSIDILCLCDHNYTLEPCQANEITPTGLLVIAKLEPRNGSLPGFWFRWDEKADALDVDIRKVPDNIKNLFEKGQGGYRGHRTKRISPDKKEFEADIRIPRTRVYRGFLSFNLERKLSINTQMGLI